MTRPNTSRTRATAVRFRQPYSVPTWCPTAGNMSITVAAPRSVDLQSFLVGSLRIDWLQSPCWRAFSGHLPLGERPTSSIFSTFPRRPPRGMAPLDSTTPWHGPVISRAPLPHGHGGRMKGDRRNHGHSDNHACLPLLIRTRSGRKYGDHSGMVPRTPCPPPHCRGHCVMGVPSPRGARDRLLLARHTRPRSARHRPARRRPPPSCQPPSRCNLVAAAGSHSHSATWGSSLPGAHPPSAHAVIGRHKSVCLVTWIFWGRAEHKGSPTSTTAGRRGGGAHGMTGARRVEFPGRSYSLHRSDPRQHVSSSPACRPRAASRL